jgi:hypothetical protein
LLDLLGRDIASSRPQCATLALGTLKGAVKTVEMNRKLRAAGHTDEEISELRRAIAAQVEGTGLKAEKEGRTRPPPFPEQTGRP